jgi:choline kinase
MRAVILAAGRGHRLREVTADRPKCLAQVGDCTLLARQMASLRRHGIDRIVVVAGFNADSVRLACDRDVELVINTRYHSTNSLYSLWLARNLLKEGFVVMNCDVLFHDQLLADLLTARDEDALLMCANRGTTYSDEEMKIRVRGGCVSAIAKTLPAHDVDGENVGIAKFGAPGAALLIEQMGSLLAQGGTRDWLPSAFAAFARLRPLRVVETRGFPWTEIDFPEDYERACRDVLPAIASTHPDGERRQHLVSRRRQPQAGSLQHV